METPQIASILQEIFSVDDLEVKDEVSWQVNSPDVRLLVLLSADKNWLRIMTPIASQVEAQPLLSVLMEDNFDVTEDVRYALSQDLLWGVFQHNFASLTPTDFQRVVTKMIALAKKGLSEAFQQLVQQRVKQIIQAAKAQGQDKETTFKNLERFYQEGMLGDLDRDPQEREDFLAAWQRQLDRLWDE